MSDTNNHPVDEEITQVVEPQDKPKTVEELNEGINKLKANRDLILTEKRAIKEARDLVDAELTETKTLLSESNKRYTDLLKITTKSALLAKIKPLEGCQEFFSKEFERFIQLEGDEVKIIDDEGQSVTDEQLIEMVNSKYGQFLAGPESSGPMGFGSAGSSVARGNPKNNPNQNRFGLK